MDTLSRISRAEPDGVEVRGHDLAELMGRVTFTEYFHLLLTGREPTDDERFFLDLLLVAIAEHGLMPSNVAARMTLAADPESLQGAVAAGILGAGSVILGAAGECARLLDDADERGAETVVYEIHAAGGRVPGFGHPLHKPVDPVLLKARVGACLEKKRLRDQELRDRGRVQVQRPHRSSERRSARSASVALPPAAWISGGRRSIGPFAGVARPAAMSRVSSPTD